MSDIVERLSNVQDFGHTSLNLLHQNAAQEIARLRTLLSEAEQREKAARVKALEDAAKVAETYKRKVYMHWDDPEETPELKQIPFQDDIAAAIRLLQSEERQVATLTEAQFSMLCSYIAKNAAAWAGDILTLPERYNRESDPVNVARFTDEIRGKLDRLDEMAGRTTPTETTKPGWVYWDNPDGPQAA